MYLDQINNQLIKNFYLTIKQKFSLTNRELDVLVALSIKGGSNRELADTLGIAEKTIKNHISNLQAKLNAHSSREIQAVVFRETLLPVFVFGHENKQKGRRKNGIAFSV
ncbi:response regulator transcription factor [Paenibacillus sp. MMO-177]|uniref:response regulator transcription factor n=1 Tax=Paenibacillus sp. MMO-177 TaxID=3081289 RepID=UPI003018D598